jgi:hypothetical protein
MKRVIIISLITLLATAAATLSFGEDERPPLFPNTKKYRDSEDKATGRSGSATLAARALLGQDKITELQVTTGQFDSNTPASGKITKIQVKAFTRTGELAYVRNYNHLHTGDLFVTRLKDLVRGETLQIRANVRGIGGKGADGGEESDDEEGTDVVTVTTTVKLRPDLKVESLAAPLQISAGAITNISAVVGEINGDTGATADCVLYVDGARVDHALNIWVDRNGTVTCAFTYNFPALGTKQLSVKVENVVPGDYDLSNNSASMAASVLASQVLSVASFLDDVYSNVNSLEINYTSTTPYSSYTAVVTSDAAYRDEYHSRTQWAHLTTYTPMPINWKNAVITVAEISDGKTVLSSSFSGLAALSCVSQYQSATGTNLYACSTPSGAYITYNRWAGEVTYYSSSFTYYWYKENWNNGFVFSYSSNYVLQPAPNTYQYGILTPVGSQYGFDIKIQDGPAAYVASPRTLLQPANSTVGTPWTCSPLPQSGAYTNATGSSCEEHLQTLTQEWGYTTW